jgi:hypothetical protein
LRIRKSRTASWLLRLCSGLRSIGGEEEESVGRPLGTPHSLATTEKPERRAQAFSLIHLISSDYPQKQKDNHDQQNQTDAPASVIPHPRPHSITAKTENKQQNNEHYQQHTFSCPIDRSALLRIISPVVL